MPVDDATGPCHMGLSINPLLYQAQMWIFFIWLKVITLCSICLEKVFKSLPLVLCHHFFFLFFACGWSLLCEEIIGCRIKASQG